MASGGPGHARRPPSAADVRDENGHESGAHARCARRHSQARRWCGGGPATFAFFCLGALPRMAGVQWDRASPFSVSAKGGDLLTITGAFETSATYECEFSPLEIGSSTVTSAAFAPEDSTKVVCTTPQWDRAAQRTRLRVLDQGTTQPIAGPGDPAAIITFTASWTEGKVDGSTSTGNAVGGSKIEIDGFGFDIYSSDYACIFVSKSDEQKVAQSVVPVKPGSSKALSCYTPRWPFDASGSAGVTKIYLEKGGQDIPFDSITATNREFQYTHMWEKISVAQGLSTYGSEVITVEGGGFKIGSEEYSCVLRGQGDAASTSVGLAATVLSSTRIQCISPHWKLKEAMTYLKLYKENCEGARGMHADCVENKRIPKTTADEAEFSFVQAARNLSVNFAEASNEGATMITVYGGGFDPDRNDYAVEWSFGNDTVIVNVTSHTAYSLEVELPQWAYTPNVVANVTVLAGSSRVANSFDSTMTFEWKSSWTTFVDEAPANEGTSAGGDLVTIIGKGFVLNASQAAANYVSGVGIDDNYACKFTDETGFFLLSDRVKAVTRDMIVCTTPAWGQDQVGDMTRVTLVKGDYEYTGPSMNFNFVSSWQSLSATEGPVGGGVSLTVNGVGFNESKTFRCKFSYNDDELFAYTDPVLPVSANQVVFTTPRWGSWQEGRTKLFVYEGGVEMLQIVETGAGMATYQFLPGFVVSHPTLVIAKDGVGTFTFYPDTEPTDAVLVKSISNDSTIADVSSPYTINPDGGIEQNTKDVSVRCLRPGSASISLASSGGNFGHTYLDQVFVLCKAGIIIDKRSASLTRGSSAFIKIQLDPEIVVGNISVSVTSSDIGIVSIHEHLLVFEQNASKMIHLQCVGVGRAHLLFHTVSVGGNSLYEGVQTLFPVYGMPGYKFPLLSVDVMPGRSVDIEFQPDTPPSLKTDFFLRVADPSVVAGDEKVYFPAMRAQSKAFTVSHLKPGITTVSLRGRSLSLLEQVSVGCSMPEAMRCTEEFVQSGCPFQGSNATGGDSTWTATMLNISALAGVNDCSAFRGCFRASCCASDESVQCITALQRESCSLYKILPTLSTVEDETYDFGAVPADLAKTELLYKSWEPGINCEPYVPCAWAQCFSGPGNFEGVESQAVLVKALPGFEITPSRVNLIQGRPAHMIVALQAVPDGNVNFRIHVVDSDRNILVNPVAHIHPKEMVLSSSRMNHSVRVQWLQPGRMSLLLVADENSGEYANVSHFFENVISASPGFVFSQVDPKSDTGGLIIRNGIPFMQVKKGHDFKITMRPGFQRSEAVAVDIVPLAGGMLNLHIEPSFLHFAANDSDTIELTLSSNQVGESRLLVQTPGSSLDALKLHVLSSGVGYTAGSISISNYDGSGFAATYQVGIVRWGFYVDPELGSARVGANYSHQGHTSFVVNHSSPTRVSVGPCFRGATALLFSGDTHKVTGHSGDIVKGCAPQITAVVSTGSVVDLIFDSASCVATGVTCQLSLEAYNGSGFHGFFSTGIKDLSIAATGSGYNCDWACFTSVSSESGLVQVSGHGSLGHAQSCPVSDPACSDGFSATAQIVYGNVGDVEAEVTVVAFAAANISADLSVLRPFQTATITVLPLELPTGNVSFIVSANTDLLELTDFHFVTGSNTVEEAAKTFTAKHLGGGSMMAKVSVFGIGSGNFDGFIGTVEINLLPGLSTSVETVNLQLFPGFFVVEFGPDSPPNKDTEVMVHISTDFGKDILLDSYGEKLLDAPPLLIMPAGSTSKQDLKIMHGGVGSVKMRNRVSGTAIISFSVNDPASNYHGLGIEGSSNSIFVDVKPGFESNIQDTYLRYLQAHTVFALSITLDHVTTQSINISAMSSDESIAKVNTNATILAGQTGPIFFNVEHQGLLGEATISLRVDTPGGNYDSVTGLDYLRVVAVPGISVSSQFVHLQYVKRTEMVQVGLDTKPDVDVEVLFSSSDPHVVGVTSSIHFSAFDWTPSTKQTITVMWHGIGEAYIKCECISPGGNYNLVYRTDLVKVRSYLPLSVSKPKVRIQKYGSGEFAVIAAMKPTKETIFTVTSTPSGIVNASGPYMVGPGTNDSFLVSLTHLHMGSATVRVFASAPGDIYDGAAADVQVVAMPGFLFSSQELLLYSCPRSTECVQTFTFAPEIIPTSDVSVTISISDASIATVEPSSLKLLVANGTSSTERLSVTYQSPGSVCINFAATSVGNYDLVSSGGVSVIALPDFVISNFIITPTNGGRPHGIDDFDASNPIIYVQKESFSTFTIAPSILPKGEGKIHIMNPRPDLVTVTSSVIFKDGDDTAQVVTVTHHAIGEVRISILGEGGNYDRAKWDQGILVKALPSLKLVAKEVTSGGDVVVLQELLNQGMNCPNAVGTTLTSKCVNIAYREQYDFHVYPTDPILDTSGSSGGIILNSSVEYMGSLTMITPSVILDSLVSNQTITVRHTAIFVDPANPFFGLTKMSIRAFGPATNYHHVEAIIDVNLDFPGFALSTTKIHVQRWKGSTLTGTERGEARVTLTPNEAPDSTTTVKFSSNSEFQPNCEDVDLFCPIESQEYVTSNPVNTDQRNQLVWYVSDGTQSKYIQAKHEGQVVSTAIQSVAPVAPTWPPGAQYQNADGITLPCSPESGPSVSECPGYLMAVYSGLVKAVPTIEIYNHAGFEAPLTEISVQRQSSGEFTMKLDTIPMDDTTVYFESSDPSVVTVQESAHFFQGEDVSQNISVFAVSPGTAFISFRSTSASFDYDSAEAMNAVEVTAMKGIGLSKLLIYLQAHPTENGQNNFTIYPDTDLTQNLTVAIISSNTAQVSCTSSVTFVIGPVTPQSVILDHVASGSEKDPVMLSFAVTTTDPEYNGVRILPIIVIPLGTFVVSHASIKVQKSRSASMSIAPNVAPDQDVEILIVVSNTSVVTATPSVKFLANKVDPVTFMLEHVSPGSTTLSFKALSPSGNYNGAYLNHAVQVHGMVGFQAWTRVAGEIEPIPKAPITSQRLLVQSQPTSHLSYAHFLVTTDIIPDQVTSVEVKSDNDNIVKSLSNVTFQAGVKEFKAVTVEHGGSPGVANIYFSASSVSSSGNYHGIESGNVMVEATPGFIFSAYTVDVQQNRITNVTVRPDLEPTGEVELSLISSDPFVVNVTESLVFTAAGGVGPKNTKIISIGYAGLGTAAISVFAKGANFDGVIYSNVIVAASRPGFTISESNIVIPYSGSYSVFFQADTVPTDDVIVAVTSSQPSKAAPTVSSFVLKAGTREIQTLTIKSWCSVSPGNCARAGNAVIDMRASSLTGSGNYDGVESVSAIIASVSAPKLSLSTTFLYIQQTPGYSTFTVSPTIPLNEDTVVSFEPLDAAICSVSSSVVFSQAGTNAQNTKQVTVTFLSVGETNIKVEVKHPLNSNYVNIDPVFVYIRTLASLTVTPSLITLQPLTSIAVKVAPAIEIDSVLTVNLATTDSNVMSVSPSTLTFHPPSNLIGNGVNVEIGLRVVVAEKFQVFPRLGTGTIIKILNDNLDLVSVDFDNGLQDQTFSVGSGGEFMLALYEDLTQTITVEHKAYGDSSVFFQGHSIDVNYNGLDFQNAVQVHAAPSFTISSANVVLQYQRSTTITIQPRVAPSDDISIQARVVTVGEHTAGELRSPSDIVQVTPQHLSMNRVDGIGSKNQRTLTVFCAKTGSVQIELEGTGGNHGDILYHPIEIRCLPGLLVSPTAPPVLKSPLGSAEIMIRPNVIPTDHVTVVVLASRAGVVRHTLRLYFEPYKENQVQILAVHHGGSYFDDECTLSLQGYGGNFDGVDIPDAVRVQVLHPDLVVPVRAVSLQPNSFTTLAVYLDTQPSSGTIITAVSSDPSRVAINGPLLVYDTSEQLFTLSHVAPGHSTITFSLTAVSPDSTYSNVSLSKDLYVQVSAMGSGFIVSASQVSIVNGAPETITIGPDAVPDSRVKVIVETVPAGIVSIQPSVVYFDQDSFLQFATFTLTWLQPGKCAINLNSIGGNFHEIARDEIVTVTALPTLPAAPLMVQSRKLAGRKLEISFSPPASGADQITSYVVEISVDSVFSDIILTSDLAADLNLFVTETLNRGVCYHYRVGARNKAGLGPKTAGPLCTKTLDAPTAVRNLQVKTISEESVLLRWAPPADSGDGTPDGIAIQRYDVEVRLEDGTLSEKISCPTDRRAAVLRIAPGTPYTVNIHSVTSISETQHHSAQLQVEYSGEPLTYDVPLSFVFSSTEVIASTGSSTSFLISPTTAPYLDAIVHVTGTNDQSATSTPRLVFKKGSVAPQYVIITHKRKGITVLSFSPEGGYFDGLDSTVTVETLGSEA